MKISEVLKMKESRKRKSKVRVDKVMEKLVNQLMFYRIGCNVVVLLGVVMMYTDFFNKREVYGIPYIIVSCLLCIISMILSVSMSLAGMLAARVWGKSLVWLVVMLGFTSLCSWGVYVGYLEL